MTIAHGASGTDSGGTTSCAPAYPSGITAGQMLVMGIVNKYPAATPTTPAGWQMQATVTGGSGSSGTDTGQVRSTVFTRIADGTESGSVTVTVTGANCCYGRILRYTRDAAKTWGVATATASQNTGGSTTWTSTATANPGIASGDMVICVDAVNADAYTWGGRSCSATGATFTTHAERLDGGSSQGDGVGAQISDHTVTAGVATAAPVHTVTASGSATDSPAGATVFLVLREVSPPPGRLSLGLGVGI